jgi:hypothetical protein
MGERGAFNSVEPIARNGWHSFNGFPDIPVSVERRVTLSKRIGAVEC